MSDFSSMDSKKDLLRSTAGHDPVSLDNRRVLAQVLSDVWKTGAFEPDLLGGIFTRINVAPGVDAKFPLDFYSPTISDTDEHTAFVVPAEGKIPNRVIDGDEVHVPTYKIANAISWNLDYARDARWDVIERAIEVFTNGFTRKMNDDGWHVVLAAAANNSVTNDTAAGSGVFTKPLLTSMQTAMKRLTGNRDGKLTDLFLSPEAIADIRNFSDTVVDDATLRALINHDGEAPLPSLFGVTLHEVIDMGVGQEYQTYLTGTVGASLAASDAEFCVGLDLGRRDSFVMPVREDMEMFDDPSLHRSGKAGVYGWMELGFAALDNRRAILGSL